MARTPRRVLVGPANALEVVGSDGSAVDLDRFLGFVGEVDLAVGVSVDVGSIPTSRRIFSLISTIMSTFSDRKVLAFSRPWPSCSPS